MGVDWFLAVRILRDGKLQTLLVMSGVGIGVAVIVFLSALISGLQTSLIEKTLGTQAHVTVQPPEERARPVLSDDAARVLRRVETSAQRVRSIDGWQQLVASLDAEPRVDAVSPMAMGPAFALRGSGTQSVVAIGVDPRRLPGVIDVPSKLVTGAFDVSGRNALVGTELLENLGLAVGDNMRLQAADGTSELFRIGGVFDLGNRVANQSWVIVSLRNGQSLMELPGGVSRIDIKLSDLYGATAFADLVRERTGLKVDSWMETNGELLVALRSQSASSNLIQVFVILAVAIGIASVLVVSVVQRSREIGILRAMGVSRQRILRVFLLQGAVVGITGSAVGIALGSGLSVAFMNLAASPNGEPLFPVQLTPSLLGVAAAVATVTGVMAALLPARRAASLDPVAAIRND